MPGTRKPSKSSTPTTHGADKVRAVEREKQEELYELYTPEAYADLIKRGYRELKSDQEKFDYIQTYFSQKSNDMPDFKKYRPYYLAQQTFALSDDCLNQIKNEIMRVRLKELVKSEIDKRETKKIVDITLKDHHGLFKPTPTSDKKPSATATITEKLKRMLKRK